MTKIEELTEKRTEALAAAQGLRDTAKSEKRDLSEKEIEQFDAAMDDVDGLDAEIADLEKIEERENRLVVAEERLSRSKGRKSAPGGTPPPTPDPPEKLSRRFETAEAGDYTRTSDYRTAINRFFAGGNRLTLEDRATLEQFSMSQDKSVEGGYLSPDVQFVNQLIQAVDNRTFMRGLATVFMVTNADSLGAPSLENDPADPTWTGELSIGTEDTTMDFGQRQLTPHPLAQFIKVSRKLMRTAAMDPERLVRERLAYKLAVVEENAFLNGDGANTPLGIFTASNNGIPTGQDVSTGNTTTALTADGLIECMYSLKEQYQRSGSWIFHRTAVKNIRKLKDGEGNYLWQRAITSGEPGTILDRPFFMSEYAPSTFTTGLYVGIFGDFSNYWIATALNMEIQRLDELYAATNQVGFISRMESDGMPVLSEAFARVTLA